MAEARADLIEGPIDSEAMVIECEAAGAIAQWDPVILGAVGRDSLPKVATTTSAESLLKYGVKVGPAKTLVDGDVCAVVIRGRTKVRIISTTIIIGDSLSTSATAGKVQETTRTAHPGTYAAATAEAIQDENASVLGIALSVGAADGDIIIMDVNPSEQST